MSSINGADRPYCVWLIIKIIIIIKKKKRYKFILNREYIKHDILLEALGI